jgi:hypothetical protein
VVVEAVVMLLETDYHYQVDRAVVGQVMIKGMELLEHQVKVLLEEMDMQMVAVEMLEVVAVVELVL